MGKAEKRYGKNPLLSKAKHYFIFPSLVGNRRLVVYWGQNSAGNDFPNNYEEELTAVCQNREYDIVVIGFVVTFFDPNNKGMTSTCIAIIPKRTG